MYTLYIANKNYSSWSLRPWVLMQTLGIPFEEKLVPFVGASGGSWSTYRQFSPSGKAPTLQDGDVTVWDSLAIVEYLAERYPACWPADATARAYARSAAAEMHSGFSRLRNECPMSCGIRVELSAISPALKADVDRISELWRTGLDRFGGPFLGGPSFTAVDAFFAPVAFRVQSYGLPIDPQAAAYVERLLHLPAMTAWYEAAIAEPWRAEDHEEETRAAGRWIADLRVNAQQG